MFSVDRLFQVIGQDIYARFIDAACRLKAGQAVQYVIDGQTCTAVAPPGDCFRNIIFKQVFTAVETSHWSFLFSVVLKIIR